MVIFKNITLKETSFEPLATEYSYQPQINLLHKATDNFAASFPVFCFKQVVFYQFLSPQIK